MNIHGLGQSLWFFTDSQDFGLMADEFDPEEVLLRLIEAYVAVTRNGATAIGFVVGNQVCFFAPLPESVLDLIVPGIAFVEIPTPRKKKRRSKKINRRKPATR